MSEVILRKYHGLGNDYLVFDPNCNEAALTENRWNFCAGEMWVWEQMVFCTALFLMVIKFPCAF